MADVMPMQRPAPNPVMERVMGNQGPAVAPQQNHGNVAAAMQMVKTGIEALQKALPMIPMGSPLHQKILSTVKDLSKETTEGGDNQALQMQSLIQMLRQKSQEQPMSALGKLMPGAGGAQPPAMPQPAAA